MHSSLITHEDSSATTVLQLAVVEEEEEEEVYLTRFDSLKHLLPL
jgi:hypothetical protein